MKTKTSILISLLMLGCLTVACSENKLEKGFQVSPDVTNETTTGTDGITPQAEQMNTRPGSVLLTGKSHIRLTPIYKVNHSKDKKETFIGTNLFYWGGESGITAGNNWNYHLMPGIEAAYGFNMVNLSHYNLNEDKQKTLFDHPVLIKTIYYPACSKDTLNHQPVSRNYFIVSVYNEDTNKDGFINFKDLRRIYLFDIHGEKQKALVPEDYSVFKSEYDSGNDFMYLFAQLDTNKNGQKDEGEPVHIFWTDLKDPQRTGRQY